VGNGIEKSPNVGVQYVVHVLPRQRVRQGVQRLMRAAPRSESVREAQKVLFIDRVEDRDHGLLDNLVLQRCHPHRALPPVGFRDVHPSRRLGSIRATVDAAVQVGKPTLQPRLILLPRHPVHPRGRSPLQGVKALPQ